MIAVTNNKDVIKHFTAKENKVISKEDIITRLKTIYDPEIPVNIYDLGLIYDINIIESNVQITMTLTTATCPAAAFMPEEVKTVILEGGEVNDVQVTVVYEPRWTRERMTDEAKEMLGFS
jgi:metal-sulfur cluster biosynthetic enzyme